MLFQPNAWVDTDTAVAIAELYKKDPVFAEEEAPEHGRLFFFDNLDAHLSDNFETAMEPLQGHLFSFPPNMTDVLQPGKLTKLASRMSDVILIGYRAQLMRGWGAALSN